MVATASYMIPGVLEQLRIDARRRKYAGDFDSWVRGFLGQQIWAKQREIGDSVRDNRLTAVAAGHATGKSFDAGLIACWWVDTHPWNEAETFVATTAPSKDQVDLIWGYIRQFHQVSQQRFADGLADHALPGYITGDNKWKLANGQMLGQGRKPPDSKSDIAFQGRHATYLLAIGDEAVGLSQGFLRALGVIATGPENRILLLMNPTDPGSAVAQLWPDKDGRGGNPEWNRIHISVLDGPMFKHDPDFDASKVTGMSGPEFLAWAAQEYGGEEDPQYIARVLGEWAWDNGAGFFSEENLSRAMRCEVVPDEDAPIRFGVDIAGAGKDDTQVYEARDGWVWEDFENEEGEIIKVNSGKRGVRIRYLDSWSKAPVTSSNPENLGTAQRLDKWAGIEKPKFMNIDASGGLGYGLFGALSEMEYADGVEREYHVFEVFGGSQEGVDRRVVSNLRSKMFNELKKAMAAGTLDLDPSDTALFNELRGVRYKMTALQQIQMETKEEMKKRGAKSPDRADAVWYAFLDPSDLVADHEVGDVIVPDLEEFAGDYGHAWWGSSRNGW